MDYAKGSVNMDLIWKIRPITVPEPFVQAVQVAAEAFRQAYPDQYAFAVDDNWV